MFSRVGRQTIAEALCFQDPDNTVLSTAAKEKLLQSQLEAKDEDEEEQYDIADLTARANPVDMSIQNVKK